MRKILLIIMITLLSLVAIFTITDKLEVGNLKIEGISYLKDKKEDLNNTVNQASKLITVDYPGKLTLLNTAVSQLQKERDNYNELLLLNSANNDQNTNTAAPYELEYLWAQIGGHVKKEGVKIKFQLTSNMTVTGTYDIGFTVTGNYVGITDFIYDIENDSKLGFKIENFKLVPNSSENELVATFNCKEISINLENANLSATTTDTKTTTGTSTPTTNTTTTAPANTTTTTPTNTTNP